MSASKKNLLFAIVILLAVTAYTMFGGKSGTGFSLNNDILTIGGPEEYSFSVPCREIAAVSLAEGFDPGLCLTGGSTRKYCWGTWQNAEFGEYELCMLTAIDDCVVVTDTEGKHYVFNLENERTTNDLVPSFQEYLDTLTEEE